MSAYDADAFDDRATPTRAPREPSLDTARVDDLESKLPEYRRRFNMQFRDYEELSAEVEQTLKTRLKKEGIAVAAIKSRAKSLESFEGKLQRKKYDDPFKQVTDFAGVRVVCFHPDDLPKIGRVIEDAFEHVAQTDKKSTREVDRFGYSAVHYNVRYGRKATGARYDHINELECEIQARTVLQDAWATFSHQLDYKVEDEVPESFRRTLMMLAAVLELADVTFESIRDQKLAYIASLSAINTASITEAGRIKTTFDSVAVYLRRQFPGYPQEYTPRNLANVLQIGNVLNTYPTIESIHALIERTHAAREEFYRRVWPDSAREIASTSGELQRALIFENPDLGDAFQETELARETYHTVRQFLARPRGTVLDGMLE